GRPGAARVFRNDWTRCNEGGARAAAKRSVAGSDMGTSYPIRKLGQNTQAYVYTPPLASNAISECRRLLTSTGIRRRARSSEVLLTSKDRRPTALDATEVA